MNYDTLKAEALAHPKKRSRIILVPGYDMIICLHRDSYVRMHRHPRYEAYHVLEGELIVTHENAVCLYAQEAPYVCIPPLTWHSPVSRTEFVIYREFYCGPFEKEKDVLYAPWAMQEAA